MNAAPLWVEAIVAALLLASAIACLVAAIGVVRMPGFLQRMHVATLAYTLGTWGAALACVVWFSWVEAQLALHAWLVIILMAITAPVTTVLLARAALFRARQAGREPR